MFYIVPANTKGKTPKQRQIILQGFCRTTYGNTWGDDIYQQSFAWLEETDFFSAPASTKYHGSYAGGLFDHSMNVTKVLLHLTNKSDLITWNRSQSPMLVGILHDVTKIDRYALTQDMNPVTQEMEPIYLWNKDHVSLSDIHGQDSALLAAKHTDLTEEEILCIRWHMGSYETEGWKEYDLAIRQCPNVLWTHMADMIASKLMEGGSQR